MALMTGHAASLFETAVAAQRSGNTATAASLLAQLLEAYPRHARAWAMRSIVEPKEGSSQRCLEYAEKAYSLKPDMRTSLVALCKALHRCYSSDKSKIDLLRRATRLLPEDATVQFRLGQACRAHKLEDEAAEQFAATLKIDAGHERAKFWLAALRGTSAVDAAPVEHLRALYDEYADSYDRHLSVGLDSKTPELCAEALRDASSGVIERCLDLGCGTGLSGAAIRAVLGPASLVTLEGVDLSEKMCERARERECYAEVRCSEAVEALQKAAADDATYDALVSSDVLPYFGELRPVLEACHGAGKAGSLLIFSLEDALHPSTVYWELSKTGRYRHRPDSVLKAANDAHFDLISHTSKILRKQAGLPVKGHIYVFRRRDLQ